MTDQTSQLARANLLALQQNAYPGRGIIVGMDYSGNLVQVYWIMGRSPNSQNRVFRADTTTGRLYTEAADATRMQDPSLVIYNAMLQVGPYYIVSNGDQTDTISEHPALFDRNLNTALRTRRYEPDDPHFTPRITAVSILAPNQLVVQMSILRKSPLSDQCDRALYEYNPYPGFGHCVTTYLDDGDPLPSFRGDPLLMPLKGTERDIAFTYWDALNDTNRVSLAVKTINTRSGLSGMFIINKHA